MERRLHRIDNGIAEREILFLRSTDGVLIAGIPGADGGVIGGNERFLRYEGFMGILFVSGIIESNG